MQIPSVFGKVGSTMDPQLTGKAYDRIARRWQENTPARYGVGALERAITYVTARGRALDVGCGSTGRFVSIFEREGFVAEGIDVSAEMIGLARERNPRAKFRVVEAVEWEPDGPFDLITAWDSTFHLPLDLQEPVTRKFCRALNPGGVLLFTCGGGPPGEITGSFWEEDFGYSTLGVEGFLRVTQECGCRVLHVEYDQWPEKHVQVVVQKTDEERGPF